MNWLFRRKKPPVPEVIQVLKIGPEDTLVLAYPRYLTPHIVEGIKKSIAEEVGCNKVIILECGMKVQAVLTNE